MDDDVIVPSAHDGCFCMWTQEGGIYSGSIVGMSPDGEHYYIKADERIIKPDSALLKASWHFKVSATILPDIIQQPDCKEKLHRENPLA